MTCTHACMHACMAEVMKVEAEGSGDEGAQSCSHGLMKIIELS